MNFFHLIFPCANIFFVLYDVKFICFLSCQSNGSAKTENYFQFIDVRIKNLIPNVLQLLFYPYRAVLLTIQPNNSVTIKYH